MQDGSFSSRSEFQAAVRQFFETVGQRGVPELRLIDPDFSDWPLGEKIVVEYLTAWARQPCHPSPVTSAGERGRGGRSNSRSFILLAHRCEFLQTRYPRFATWRRQWAHLVHCKTPEPALHHPLPTLLIAPDCAVLRLLNPRTFQGKLSSQAADQDCTIEQFDAILQRSVDTFPASVLGL
jgi:hypothetical protein